VAERGPESDGRPAPARLTIPDLGLWGFRVVPYQGRTDDARGTEIQNGGALASPHGPRGGTGPGGVGNYQVTGHRLSSSMPFRYLPRLTRGDEVYVESGGTRYVYRIVTTRETSFRSTRSLREQRAAVPGRPGAEPTRAMLTLSTCATLEDHAAGNFWADRFDNPEHRIDKIGVLVRSVPLVRR
jgi:sortase A